MAFPTPTPVPAILNGFVPQGTSDYLWIPSVANLNSPTSAECTAGTLYTKQVAGIDGFNPQGATVDFPNASALETPNIPGPYGLGEGTVTFNLGKSGSDARTVFKGGIAGITPTTGVWAFADEGFTTGNKFRLFAVICMSANPTMDMGTPKTLPAMFSIQGHTDYITIPTV